MDYDKELCLKAESSGLRSSSLGTLKVLSLKKVVVKRFSVILHNIFPMEVIIDYYEEEYPCFIYPDRTVLANKEEIAVCLIRRISPRITFHSRLHTSSCSLKMQFWRMNGC